MFRNLNTFKKNWANMDLSPGNLNKFLILKLPSAWLCGVRVKRIDPLQCEVSVNYSWINKNPFNSMYFAVQAMAAELSTGALVMSHIRDSGQKISMLVAQNKASFTKKATGRITFFCTDGDVISQALEQALATGEGQTFWMRSTGTNEEGIVVSVFEFQWTIKLKSQD